MREYNIRTSPLEFLNILELQIEEEVNCHGKGIISGYISDEQEEEYLGMLTGEVWEQIRMIGKEGEVQILFHGIVTDFSMIYCNDQKKLTLEIMSGSVLMDGKRHLRSFQNPVMTYGQILKEITAEYQDSGIVFNEPWEERAGELVLQYYETDWEFFKRLASRKHQFLVPNAQKKGVKLSYALPVGERFVLSEGQKYTMRKNLSAYRKKVDQDMSVSESDCLEYMVESREAHRIGDCTTLFGELFYIYQIKSRYIGGELLHFCYMKRKRGIEVPEVFQEEMAGCSLSATVTAVKEDKVQVAIAEDENKEQETAVWYPYATVYSTPDGTGWYCMPEPGDRVRLTVPEKWEKDAFVSSSVHVGTESADRKNPEYKVFKSKYQKEVRFTPTSIVITNNQGNRIEMTDKEGIRIISDHSVMLEAAEDLTIISNTGSLLAAGASSVSFKQKGTSIELENDISFMGGNLKIQ